MKSMNARVLALSLIAAAALTACGGGGGSDSPLTPQPISGTAAAGAPVIGTVTVKDSAGVTKTTAIAADGSYSVDVAGMTGPFVFLASGTVGGRTIEMVSAATAADVNKTVNITPFTDLIVANLAGQAASSYYASPSFAKLTAVDLDAARQILTTRLRPILDALGVEAGFDLLRSSFKADRSGFDAVLDVVRVTTDAATNTATISDLVNQTKIEDDLASKTDTTALPAPVASLADISASLKGIDASIAKFSTAFATSLPTSDNAILRGVVSTDMLDWGGGANAFLSTEGILDPRNVGIKQSAASIVKVSDGGATIDVEWLTEHKFADYYGKTSNQWKQQFRRNASGVWQYAGNRRWAYVEMNSINARFPRNGSWEYRTYINEYVETRNTVAAYALLAGPGLSNWSPASLPGFSLPGVVLGRNGKNFKGYSVDGNVNSTWIPDCLTSYGQDPYEVTCVDLTNVSAASEYTVTLLDANGVPLGAPEVVKLAAKPYSVAEAATAGDSWFGRLLSSNPSTLAGLSNGKLISYTMAAPTNSAYTLWKAAIGTPNVYLEGDIVGTTADVGAWSGPAPSRAEATVVSRDAAFRRFVSFYNFQ